MGEPNTRPSSRRLVKAVKSITASDLSDLQLLRSVGLEGVVGLLERCPVFDLDAEEQLIRRGDQGGRMYMVLSGRLRVHLEDLESDPIAFIEAGDTVGELSILDTQPASAHVVAHTKCRLLEADEITFWGLVRVSHDFAANLLLRLAGRLRNNNRAVSQNVALRRQFERAAHYDALTNVHSRRWLDSTLPRLLARHRRSSRALSVAMLDVDHFKRFNDTYGHPSGDEVLKAVSAALISKLRPTDLVARYGGEEFIVLMPETGLSGARIAAERLRVAVAATVCIAPDGEQLPAVTISIGIAELGAGDDEGTLVSKADEALYRAKDLGRNRVES